MKEFKERQKKNQEKVSQALNDLIDERIAIYLREHEDEMRSLLKGGRTASVSEAAYQALQEENKTLQAQLGDFQRQLDDKDGELQQSHRELAALQEQAASYQRLEEAYQEYRSLPAKLRGQLQGIFGQANTALAFYAEAVQLKHLESLYDYLTQCINNGQDEEYVPVLKGVLDFCLGEAAYQRVSVELGEAFDSKRMQLAAGSSQLGTVRKVCLEGYRTSGSQTPLRKSIVCIGDR